MRQRGRTRLSAKNQATIPVEALRRAGLRPGDELLVEAAGAGASSSRGPKISSRATPAP
jgi:bifunctional DNA-binding transcriptional regulator/antitoxin component of YhaV-PrlF toxin-antitoxin module